MCIIPAVSDPVADAFSTLYRREPAAILQFRDAADRALARFPSLSPEREILMNEALERAIAAVAEFKNIETAARRHAIRAALTTHAKRASAGPLSEDARLYYKIQELPPNARSFVILAIVKRGEFVEVIQKLNLNGAALAAELTSIRKITNNDAQGPPQNDIPAYVRVPFLVSGRLAPEEALKVREYLGQSEVCRAAYRDFDLIERKIARLGPAAGDGHPDPDELFMIADGGKISEERKDNIAEHTRLCGGCAAALVELRAGAPRGPAGGLLANFDDPSSRKKLAFASIAAAIALPLMIYELTAGRKPLLEFGGVGGADLGKPLMEEPGRAPAVASLGSPAPLVFTVKVRVEPNIVFDAVFKKTGAGELFTLGDAPILINKGEEMGHITFTMRREKLTPGDYQLHLLRRIRGVGGEPADWIYPMKITE